jgi:curved DNA-binding protein CbpA
LSPTDYYKTLQVDPSAEPEVIAAAYKRLSLKYHPDTNPAADAKQRMQEINEAYTVLKDPGKRHAYDLARGGARSWSAYTEPGRPQRERPYKDPSAQSPPPSYREPGRPPAAPSRKVSPWEGLVNLILSIIFPVTFIFTTTILFRVFRSPNVIVLLAVLIFAGMVSYYVTKEAEKKLRRK